MEVENKINTLTVEEQRIQIKSVMDELINKVVRYKEISEFGSPTYSGYKHIIPITYDGLEYKGKKTKIFAWYGVPDYASADNKVPAVVLVHGGGGHAYSHWVKMWNDRGYAAIAMDTTGCFPKSKNLSFNEQQNFIGYSYGLEGSFAEDGYVSGPNSIFYSPEYKPLDEQWAYHAMGSIISAHNLLIQDERINSQAIGLHGISWGGVISTQTIGYDNRFAFAIPVYGTAYLGNSLNPWENFANKYVDSLWAAEKNLRNNKTPVFWMAYNDDSTFGVNTCVETYKNTYKSNPKNTFALVGLWSHSHTAVWNKEQPFQYADWIVGKGSGFITFKTQPKGYTVNCNINIPDGVEIKSVEVYYLTEKMSYSRKNKYGHGESNYLDQIWNVSDEWLTVDENTASISGTIPSHVKGYYITVNFNIDGKPSLSSSVYTEICESDSDI